MQRDCTILEDWASNNTQKIKCTTTHILSCHTDNIPPCHKLCVSIRETFETKQDKREREILVSRSILSEQPTASVYNVLKQLWQRGQRTAGLRLLCLGPSGTEGETTKVPVQWIEKCV